MITEWLSLLTLIGVIGVWIGAMRSRERALHAARRICSAQSVQLLDETVGLGGLRLRRRDGLLRLMLRYDFEVSLDGLDRYPGHLWMVGGHVVEIGSHWSPRVSDSEHLDAERQVVDLLGRMRRTSSAEDPRIGHDEESGST
jgi:hypothetical protein